MKGKCVQCGKKAVISLPYGPHRFCKEHFLHFFEKRVRRTIRENRLVQGREKLVVACSGGKDSSTALFLINKIFSKSNPVEALLIDEGIPGYRDKALATAERNCTEWNVQFKRVSFKEEFGFTMMDVMRKTGPEKLLGSSCSFCGVLRRRLMNKCAKEMHAGKLVTGHNLNDEVQSILMNVFDADLARYGRLGPMTGALKLSGFVPRIKPLYLCPENEVISFAQMQGIDYCGVKCCPFHWQAKRNDFRAMLNEFEEKYPGTMFSIMRFFQQTKPLVAKGLEKARKLKLNACIKCSEPTSRTICRACQQVDRIIKK